MRPDLYRSDAASIVPGLTLCAACRHRDAVLVEDPGEPGERPLCFQCAEDVLERAEVPREQEQLFTLARSEARYRPLPSPRVRWEDQDMTKLEALRRSWHAFERTVVDAQRCWALLADDTRCVRAALEGGAVCETHDLMGCRLPGLGWRGDVAQGRIIRRTGRRTHGKAA